MTEGWKHMPDGQPRTCCICGERVRLGKQEIGFKTFPPLRTWHLNCSTGSQPKGAA